FAQLGDLAAGVGQVGTGRHRLNTGQRQRPAGVDLADAGVGHWTAEDAAVEEVVELQVGTVDGPPGDLIHAVMADRTRTDDFEGLAHACFPIMSAASSTARTILSYPVQRHRLPASQ